jgi:hypothetical protein
MSTERMRKAAAALDEVITGSSSIVVPVRRGQSVQTMVLGHVQCDGEWVLIGAKGAGAWDGYRIRATAIVEVRGEPTTPRSGVVAMLPIPTKPQKED